MASGCTDDGASFVSLHDLDKISTLLNEDNDLEEEITELFIEVSILIFNLKKKSQPIRLYIYSKHQAFFSSIATVWFDLEA